MAEPNSSQHNTFQRAELSQHTGRYSVREKLQILCHADEYHRHDLRDRDVEADYHLAKGQLTHWRKKKYVLESTDNSTVVNIHKSRYGSICCFVICSYPALDKALCDFRHVMASVGHSITTDMYEERAVYFAQQLNIGELSSPRSYVSRWMKRHGIDNKLEPVTVQPVTADRLNVDVCVCLL